MLHRLGYVAIALSISATTNRTCRLANATPDRLRALIAANLAGLGEVLAFNAAHGLRLYRVSSQVVPFASHPANGIAWWEEFAPTLRELGAFVRDQDMRVSMHPGQFTVLGSPDPATLASSLRELEYHVRFLDGMELDGRNKVVLHLGGGYGDKAAALRRFVGVANDLPAAWRRRLVVENDERIFSVADALEVAAGTGLPVVFDWLHHNLNPGGLESARLAMAQAFATWVEARDGLPKVHFSSQDPAGKPGAHWDWLEPEEFLRFLASAPGQDFDCMLEAKKKDLALLRLQADLAARSIATGQAV